MTIREALGTCLDPAFVWRVAIFPWNFDMCGASSGPFAAKGGMRKDNCKRKTRRGLRSGGAAILSQTFSRPISSSVPPGVLQDMQDIWYGKTVGPSPDQVQRSPVY